MRREGEIDREIERMIKLFFTMKANKKYRIVSTKKDSDMFMIFKRSDLLRYHLVVTDTEEGKELYENDNSYTIVYLKNKDPRDPLKSTLGDVKKFNC